MSALPAVYAKVWHLGRSYKTSLSLVTYVHLVSANSAVA
jgi:hypothetical protein